MYLWVIIATFITILYSFNISVRADLDRVHAETKAGVVVTKFFAQHNAVKDYLNSQATSKIGQSRVPYFPGDGYNSSTCVEGSEKCDLSSYVETYLPVGYIEDTEVVTKVFCLENGDPEAEQCTSGVGGSCCSDEYTGIYVVSFRKIPSKWINKVTTMPNADVLGYMAKARGYGKSFGYTDKIDTDSDGTPDTLVLSGGQMVQEYDESGEKVGDPKFQYHEIFNAVKSDADFVEMECDKEGVHCFYAIQQIYG